jgi:hypothetical protein
MHSLAIFRKMVPDVFIAINDSGGLLPRHLEKVIGDANPHV